MNYYRLKQVYDNGEFVYSEVKSVAFPFVGGFEMFPNPAGEFVHIELSKYKGRAVDIAIYNELGHRVYQKHLPEVTTRLHRVELREFNNGIYFIHIDSGVKPIGKKLIITRMY